MNNTVLDNLERDYTRMAGAIIVALAARMPWMDRLRLTETLDVLNADYASRRAEIIHLQTPPQQQANAALAKTVET